MIPVLSLLEGEQASSLNKILQTWHGDMSEDSVGATVFSTWQFYFYKSLLTEQIEDQNLRLALVGNLPFNDYIQRMIHTLAEDPENEGFNKVCSGAFSEYKGKKSCAFNMAKALAQTKEFLES